MGSDLDQDDDLCRERLKAATEQLYRWRDDYHKLQAECARLEATIEAARQQGFAAGVEAALKVAIEADACVVCGGALLEEYPPYCEDTCRDGWHDYMDEHGDEHQGAVSRIRALLATRPTTLEET